MAAQKGNGHAQFNLATIYTDGDKDEGVPQDLARALVWFNAAAVTLMGNEAKIADDDGKLVAKAMTREQMLTAQNIGRECKAGNYTACE